MFMNGARVRILKKTQQPRRDSTIYARRDALKHDFVNQTKQRGFHTKLDVTRNSRNAAHPQAVIQSRYWSATTARTTLPPVSRVCLRGRPLKRTPHCIFWREVHCDDATSPYHVNEYLHITMLIDIFTFLFLSIYIYLSIARKHRV